MSPLNDENLTLEHVRAAFAELEIAEPLGEGTFKTAFRAKHQNDDVVLKVIKTAIDVETEGESASAEVDASAWATLPHLTASS